MPASSIFRREWIRKHASNLWSRYRKTGNLYMSEIRHCWDKMLSESSFARAWAMSNKVSIETIWSFWILQLYKNETKDIESECDEQEDFLKSVRGWLCALPGRTHHTPHFLLDLLHTSNQPWNISVGIRKAPLILLVDRERWFFPRLTRTRINLSHLILSQILFR